ncbi:hypothetical protein ACGFNX_41770, partial [Streptomyces sp. NPDC048723]
KTAPDHSAARYTPAGQPNPQVRQQNPAGVLGVHKTVHALAQDTRTWIAAWNSDPRPYVWTKSADEILERLASYLNRIPDSED